MPPSQLVQQDFAAGACPAIAPHLIPSNGFLKGVNVLLDDDGSAYKRSGSSMKSNANFGTTGLRLLWQGILAAGERTVFADTLGVGVLAADDATPIRVGGSGYTAPVRPVALRGVLYLGGQAYAGSRLTAAYSTGTVATTLGSNLVNGTGTVWVGAVDAGMLFRVAGRFYVVEAVLSNTQLRLTGPVREAAAAGVAYSLQPVAALVAPYKTGPVVETVAGRLVVCSGNRADFSQPDDASVFVNVDGVANFHTIDEGVEIVGAAHLRDTLFLFTTRGLWAVSNMNFDLVDDFGNVQQRLDRINADLVLWSNEGIATWQDQLVVPAIDGVWLIGNGAPTLLSRSFTPTYTEYVAQGYRTGLAAVFRGHYLLPILNAANEVVDLLVCRLDRPTRSRSGVLFPWTQLQGAGARVTALAAKAGATTRTPVLLGASRDAAGRLISFGAFSSSGKADDHDGSAFVWEMVLRDIATGGQLNRNFVQRLRVRYELAAGTAVDVQAFYATDARADVARWGEFTWGSAAWSDTVEGSFIQLVGDAPRDAGDQPFVWPVGKKVRYLRVRLKSSDAATRFVLRSVELFVRSSARP